VVVQLPKIIVLKCEETKPEEAVELCDIRDKLTESGIGELLIKIYDELIDRDTSILEEMNKAQLDPTFVSDINHMLIEHRLELVSALLREADIDVKACESAEDRECITVRVLTKREVRRIGVYYINAEGDFIRVYP
jgi:hypothetical protein